MRMLLGDILVSEGFITEEQLNEGLEKQKSDGRLLGIILIEMGYITQRNLEKALDAIFPKIIKHIPLWATTNLSVGRNVPLVAGSFDLMIIDESSQCDIASVIPLLYRAKRIVVAGDPMQLPHVSTIKGDVAAFCKLLSLQHVYVYQCA